jgi:hypothetical protein
LAPSVLRLDSSGPQHNPAHPDASEAVVTPRALLRDAESGRWLRYDDPVDVLTAATPDDVPEILEEAERRAGRERLHAVGFVTYEAAPGFDAALTTGPRASCRPPGSRCFAAGSPAPLPQPANRLGARFVWHPDLSSDDYLSTIARIREYIAAGDTYQVNFTYRLRSAFDQRHADLPQRLFAAMARARAPATARCWRPTPGPSAAPHQSCSSPATADA